jgi:ribonuclease HII
MTGKVLKLADMDIHNHYQYEHQARQDGFKIVAGGDEAGRGPWAGPVFAAFVVLPENLVIPGLDDSKKLSRNKRRHLYDEIRNKALAFAIGSADPHEIDSINILEATRLAFQRAFTALPLQPDYVLLDYIKLPWLKKPHQAFAKGESISASVAAASILAKEARDLYMETAAIKYPGYGFEKHMGYGTAAHQAALQQLGPCALHRLSFKPVKKLLPEKHGHLFDFASR